MEVNMVRRSAVALLVVLSCARAASAADHPSFRVEASGTGRPMILIPGLASSGDTWDTTVARYRTRFTCHVLTVAGYAGVPPIDGPLLPAVRRDLAEYIRAQKLDRPIIVGHSLGGTLALTLAIEYPDLVGPLVIVDILPFLAGPNMRVKSVAEAQPAIAAMEAYMSTMTQAQWDASAKTGASVRYMVTGDAGFDTLKAWGLATDRQTLIRGLAEVYGADLREDIARIASPTLVLGTWRGVHEQLLANKIDVPKADFLKEFSAQYAKLPRLHFALHDSARHFIMWDDPMWFFDELDAFFADPAARVRSRGF
jgi:pimeloyl-ACP methyl ester carboxylesterase